VLNFLFVEKPLLRFPNPGDPERRPLRNFATELYVNGVEAGRFDISEEHPPDTWSMSIALEDEFQKKGYLPRWCLMYVNVPLERLTQNNGCILIPTQVKDIGII
jgi:hypothetical protein